MTNRSILRPAFLSLALLGALAFGSLAAQDDAASSAPDSAKESPKSEATDAPKDAGDKDAPDKEAPDKEAPDKAPADKAAAGDEAAAAAAPRDFSGKYLADGMSNGGRKYRAMVEITREGDVYQVVWVLGPNEGYMGVGLTEGEALFVGWSIGEVPGVVVYKPDPKPDSKKLVGRWTAPGSKGQTYTETLTPLK